MFKLNKVKKEIIFWIVLFVLLFLFIAIEEEDPYIQWEAILFIVSYFIASLFISYIIIPRYLYKKKTIKFCLSFAVVLAIVGIIEELVLEKIFYPNSRGLSLNVFATLLEIAPPILIFTGFKFALDALEKENKIEKLNRLAAENELQFLNSQINPHFLFNNLNNLYASALENSPDTPKIILQLSSILRYMLYDCRKPMVKLKNEIDNLKQFIELYRMQMGNNAKIEFTTDGIKDELQIAPLILIVFVENAFKHSQASQTEKIHINISIQVEKKTINFTCENTYTDQSNTLDWSKGIGLENVKSKLRLIYPSSHQLAINKAKDWFRISLNIEL